MNLAKQANSPNAEFEQAFFQLAFERLQDKLYNLLDYLVGFNIVHQSPDGSKAVGVFGFKADNGQTIFVPAFFKNGDVKGVDIMYSKENEQFYPLTEDFAELFLKDDPSGIGNVTEENARQLQQYMPPTDMRDLVRPPRTAKVSYASVIDFVQEGDNKIKEEFQSWLEKDAEYFESVLRFYPIEKVAKALVKKKDADKVLPVPSVQVLTSDDYLGNLSDKEKGRVFSDGYVVIDKRKKEQKSEFGIEKFEEKFTNPISSGFYPYVTSSGAIRYGIILVSPVSFDPYFNNDESLLVNMDSGFTYGAPLNNIFTKGQIVIKDLENALSGFKEPAEVKPSYDDTFILVNNELKASRPFRVAANFKDDEGLRRIIIESVNLTDRCEVSPDRPKKWTNSYFKDKNEHPFTTKRFTLVMTKKAGGNLSVDSGGIVYVPKGYKLLPIKTNHYDCCGSVTSAEGSESSYEERKAQRDKAKQKFEEGKPGTRSAVLGALTSNKVYPMTVTSNGSEYFINVAGIKKKYETPIKAKIAMITTLGLEEKQASDIMSKVENQISQTGYIKMAAIGDQSFAPWDPSSYANEFGTPTYDGIGNVQTMTSGDSYTADPTRKGLASMPDIEGRDAAIQQANQLAESGQKEVFDTHSIATLARYVSPETKVSDYMPDFISCLDKLGRMLFLVYWETDKFEQMYGRSELPEMTELLSNVFRNLGDLIIFLKRKSPELSINMTETDVAA